MLKVTIYKRELYAWVDESFQYNACSVSMLLLKYIKEGVELKLLFLSLLFQLDSKHTSSTQTDFYSRMSILDSQHEVTMYSNELKPQNQICVYPSFQFKSNTPMRVSF